MNEPLISGITRRLARGWRVFATGSSFVLFGLGGLLLWFVVFPVLRLMQPDPQRCARSARWLLRRCFRQFLGYMRWMGVLTWEVDGFERLQRGGLLVLANHPTLLDVVFLSALVPDANCVVKSALLRNPFMRGPVLASGFIHNDEGPGLIADCIASLRSGSNLIIFPEGTRTPAGAALGPLQRGAAHIAVRGGLPITPVVIRCEPPTLKKGQPWYDIPFRRMHFSIVVGPDLPAQVAGDPSAEPLAARRVTDRLRGFFLGELHVADVGTGNQTTDRVGPQSRGHH